MLSIQYRSLFLDLPSEGTWHVCADTPVGKMQSIWAFQEPPKFISGKWVSTECEGVLLNGHRLSNINIDPENSLEIFNGHEPSFELVEEYSSVLNLFGLEIPVLGRQNEKNVFHLTVDSPDDEGLCLVTMFVRSLPKLRRCISVHKDEVDSCKWFTDNRHSPSVIQLAKIRVNGTFNHAVYYKFVGNRFVETKSPLV